ncbi:MAG: SDR family oxidoreductase [Minwuia sp.]|nr:SDR family oxidoreductase [Minwuia sp.]
MSVAGRLEGKVALICGAGQTPGETTGNGRAMALLFARAGARVVAADRDLGRAEETVAMIGAEGGHASAVRCDVTQTFDCVGLVQQTMGAEGRIDVLVNNVGIGGGGDGPAHRASEEALERILDVNTTGAWRMIRAILPEMRNQGSGNIVNISSLAAFGGGNMVAYEMSKAAMNRLTTSVAIANAKYGVRCNAIAPGLMDTPMAVSGGAAARGLDTETVRQERNRLVPLRGQMGTAWDTAHAALFLASDEARFITGAILPVDGGAGVRVG